MGKLFPIVEKDDDFKDNIHIKFLKVVIASSSDYVVLGKSEDARILLGSGQALPTFYLSPSLQSTSTTFQRNVMNIDGATVGTEYVIAVRQRGVGNRNPNI